MKLKFIIFIIFSIFESLAQSNLSDDNSIVEIPDQNGQMHKVQTNSILEIFSPPDDSSIRVDFFLYTHKNIADGHKIKCLDDKGLLNSNFDPKHPTRILIHGFTGDKNSLQSIKFAYLKNGNKFNVFIVDWTSVARNPNYIYVARKTSYIGKKISKFLEFLHDVGKMRYETLYLIGHSLGAHAAGFAGKYLLHGRVNTIFGLDPAGPLFSRHLYRSEERLSKLDAEYVETIHTNGGKLGLVYPIGIASFYPNYGKSQPGCKWANIKCSHRRAVDFFVESISNRNNFVPRKCKNFNDLIAKRCSDKKMSFKMGGEPSNYKNKVEGIYYLPTNSKSPFGLS